MNGFYNRFSYRRLVNAASLVSGVAKALLLRSTGAYTFNPDHDYVADLFSNGGIECTVPSYARQTLANSAVTLDDTNNRGVWDFDNIAFGALETGQTISAYCLFEFITNDADSPLICHIDGKIQVIAAAPASLSSSGNITGITQANPGVVTSAAHGLSNGDKVYIASVGGMVEVNNLAFTVEGVTTNTFQLQGTNTSAYTAYTSGGTWSLVRPVYVEPLAEAINDGVSATIGAGTGTTVGAHAQGDYILWLRGLSANIAARDDGIVQSSLNLPANLGGGNFSINIATAGFLALPGTTP